MVRRRKEVHEVRSLAPSPISPSFFRKCLVFFALYAVFVPSLRALDLEPYPHDSFSRDLFSISIFREERPSFYWVNAGVPDAFFTGVYQLSGPPSPTIVYSVRSVEYGFKTGFWVTDDLQVRATLPFEANAILDATGNTQDVAKFGDVELAATYLLVGKRQKGDYIGVDGRFRLATGTNPFQMAYPLLSTGKGANEGAVGLLMGEEAGRFSFFQSIHYEKSQSVSIDASNVLFGAGNFQWPDNIEAEARAEFLAFRRLDRLISLYFDMRLRMSGLMKFNGQSITYGQGLTTDQLFFQDYGIVVRVDRQFSAEGKMSWFPSQLSGGRPDFGTLFELSLEFRPF